MNERWRTVGVGLLVVLASSAIFDLYPPLSDRLCRLGLGSTSLGPQYQAKLKHVAARWLQSPPRVRYDDNTRLLLWDHLRGRFFAPAAVDFEGSLFTGMVSAADGASTADREVITGYLRRSFAPQTGRFLRPPHVVDQAMICYGVLNLPAAERDPYRAGLNQMAQWLLQRAQTRGTVPYREPTHLEFVDTIGMICPFLAAYGKQYGHPEAVALAVRQIDEYTRRGVNPLGLPVHAYDLELHDAPLGIYGWGRGTGWYALGLVDTCRELPAASPERVRLAGYLRRLAGTLAELQSDDGGWRSVLVSRRSPFDASATAIFAYVLSRGVEAGILECRYQDCADRAVARLVQATRRDGTVDYSENGSYGPGLYSKIYGPSLFTQGMALRVTSLRLGAAAGTIEARGTP